MFRAYLFINKTNKLILSMGLENNIASSDSKLRKTNTQSKVEHELLNIATRAVAIHIPN